MEANSQLLEEGLIKRREQTDSVRRSRTNTPRQEVDARFTAVAEASDQQNSDKLAESAVFMSVDDMLVKHVGEFGWGQFWHFVLVSLAWIIEALHTMVMIFGDRVPKWRCVHSGAGPHVDGGVNNTLSGGIATGLLSFPTCTASSKICELAPGSWEWVGGQSTSTVSEWNLICGSEYKAGLTGSLFFIGVLTGTGVYGSLSDSFLGRKGTLALAAMTTVTLGLATAFAPSYWVYATLRFVTGLNCGGIGLCSFVLATEIVGPNKRGSVGMSAFYFFSTGIMLLPFFGYFSPTWRVLYITTAVPGILYCVLVLPFMWESPRWYLVKGRLGDAMKVLRVFAKRNGGAVPENVSLRLDCHGDDGDVNSKDVCDDSLRQEQEQEERRPSGNSSGFDASAMMVHGRREAASLMSSPKDCQGNSGCAEPELEVRNDGKVKKGSKRNVQQVGSLLDIFRHPETRRRMVIMICIWASTGVVYYGISLNVVNLNFNLYVSVFVNGLIELPAFAISAYLLGKMGRKGILVMAMALSGVCCLVGSLIFAVSPTDDSNDGSGLGIGGLTIHLNSKYSHQLNSVGADDKKAPVILMGLLRLLCGVLGIFGMAGTYNLIYIYTAELFPTVVRNAALGLAAQAAGIGSVVSPFIVVLGGFAPPIPFLIFGILALAGAGLSTRLPETLNQPLHDTLQGLQKSIGRTADPEKPDAGFEGEAHVSGGN